MNFEKKFGKIGMVARWKPVHLGHQVVLRGMCDRAESVLIGIGSSNTYDYRNPFTIEETTAMLALALEGHKNLKLVPIPDLHNGPRWRELVADLFGPLDVFVTENPYVAKLMSEYYAVVHPVEFVPKDEQIPINGSMVREAMAKGSPEWEKMVPEVVKNYIIENGLDNRFRDEFGLQTLALNAMIYDERNE